MNKLAKTIIGVLVGIIVILLIIIVLIASSKNKCKDDISDNTNNNDEIKQLVGVYTHNTTNNRVATIILNEDMTCSYTANYECKWTLLDNKKEITILLNQYNIAFDSSDKIGGIGDGSDNIETCKEKLKKYTEQYDLVNPRCEYTNNTQPVKATLINGGFILTNQTFYKVG